MGSDIDEAAFFGILFGVEVGETTALEDKEARFPSTYARGATLLDPTGIVCRFGSFGGGDGADPVGHRGGLFGGFRGGF